MYDEQEAGMPITKQCLDANPSPLEQLKRQRVFHKERLADIDAAINALESNPEVCKVLELIAKARR